MAFCIVLICPQDIKKAPDVQVLQSILGLLFKTYSQPLLPVASGNANRYFLQKA